MKEKYLSEIIYYPLKNEDRKDSLLPEAPPGFTLTGEQKSFMGSLFEKITKLVAEDLIDRYGAVYDFSSMERLLAGAYLYSFNKALEIAYCFRAEINKPILFESEKVYRGGYLDEEFPVKLLEMVNGLRDSLLVIFKETLVLVNSNSKLYKENEIAPDELIKAVLYSGAALGKAYILRLDLSSIE